jgi:hypothetical protein
MRPIEAYRREYSQWRRTYRINGKTVAFPVLDRFMDHLYAVAFGLADWTRERFTATFWSLFMLAFSIFLFCAVLVMIWMMGGFD